MTTRSVRLVEEATPDDREGMLAVARALPDWFTPRGVAMMEIDLRFQAAIVSRDGGVVAGFLSGFVHEAVAWIGWLGVHPARHRRGLGRALVEHACARWSREGVREARVDTLSDAVAYAPYAATRAFYRAQGFEDFARVAQDDPEMPERLTMRRLLGPARPA